MFKDARRDERYYNLRFNGFVPAEARLLSKAEETPAYRAMVHHRRALYIRAIRHTQRLGMQPGGHEFQVYYKDRIRKLYNRRGWTVKHLEGKVGKPLPWAMYRHFVDAIKNTTGQGEQEEYRKLKRKATSHKRSRQLASSIKELRKRQQIKFKRH